MLSVVINTWNEEKNLPRVIASVKQFAGEIVVVDAESSDRTVEVAKKLGAKVFTHKNTGVVEPIRNFAISKAKGDWILLLDADEEVPADLALKIPQLILDSEVDFYRIPRKNIIFGKWITSEHWWPDLSYRLFKKDFITWSDAIHSVPFTRGTGRDLPASPSSAIIHHNYSSINQYLDRLQRYTDYQQKELLESGYNFSWKDMIKKPVSEFLTQYFARKGYKDGLHGLSLSALQAFSELVLYLKLWQQSEFISENLSTDEVIQEIYRSGHGLRWWNYQVKIDAAPFIVKPFWKLLRKLKT